MDHQELEWQFDAANLAAVEQWLRARSAAGDVQFHFGVPEEQRDSYYDTADWRFFSAGYALRLRQEATRSEVTLKSFGTGEDGLRQRREFNQLLPGFDGASPSRALEHLEGAVGERIRAVIGKSRLTRLFEVRTQRHRIALRSDGVQIAEIALDDVSISAARRRTARLQRVEVEVCQTDGAGDDVLDEFIAQFREACDLAPAEQSKFEAGLRAHSLQPGMRIDLGQPSEADDADDPSIGALAFAVMRQHFTQFLLREPGSRLGEDIEDVHRMRVATRRLRAAMSLFREYLPSGAEALRDEIGWVAQALGGVRDLDVQLERIREWHADGESLNPDALRGLESLLCDQREHARARLLHALNSERYQHFVAEYTAMLRAGPGANAAAAKRARNELPSLILKRYVKMRALGDAIDDDSPATALHDLRIQCKRLRYALEFASGLYPKAVQNYLGRLVELQELLGQHQDAHVAIEQMRALGLTHQRELPPQTIFTLGEIAQRYAHQAEDLRAQFPKLYRRIKGKSWQQLQRALDEA